MYQRVICTARNHYQLKNRKTICIVYDKLTPPLKLPSEYNHRQEVPLNEITYIGTN